MTNVALAVSSRHVLLRVTLKDTCWAVAEGIWAERRVLITGIGLLVVLPMCFPRNLGALAWVSITAVLGFVFVVIAVMLRSTQIVKQRFPGHRWDSTARINFDLQALSAVPIVVFGFNCHANVVTIMSYALLTAPVPNHLPDYAEGLLLLAHGPPAACTRAKAPGFYLALCICFPGAGLPGITSDQHLLLALSIAAMRVYSSSAWGA